MSDSFGVGVRGKPAAQVEIGADLSYSDIKDKFQRRLIAGELRGQPLPDVTHALTRLNLFARYVLEKRSGLRFDYIFDRFSTNDWTWTNLDVRRRHHGSREDPTQKVNFIGVSYYYRFQ